MNFEFGQKCFAKVKGFPHWPARINILPEDVKIPKGKYPIFFYGTHEVCFLSSNAIFPYEKFKTKYGVARNTIGFNIGLEELESNSTIYQYGIDPNAVKFLSQFYKFSQKKRHKSKSSKSAYSSEENTDPMEKDVKPEICNNDQLSTDVQPNSVPTSQPEPEPEPMLNKIEETNEFKNPNEFLKVDQENCPLTSTNIINGNHLSSHNLPFRKKFNVKKCRTDEYVNDFTNLLLEIRKYSWSKTKISDIKRLMKKSKNDSRVRVFFPWYQSLTKK